MDNTSIDVRMDKSLLNTSKHLEIFIVEDNKEMLEIYSIFLKKTCWEIVAASQTGIPAIFLYQQLKRKPDLVILDIELPDCSGIDLAKWILDNNPLQKIIFISANIELLYREDKLKDLPKLKKPFSSKNFLTKLKQMNC